MAQYTLDGSEKKIELVGYYASIKNNSAATIYVSQSAGMDPNGENVTPIQAGESVSIPTNADKCIYLLGSGKVAIISGNEWQNFFKTAPGQGGGGASGGVTQEQLEETLQLYATNKSVSDGLAGKVDAVEGKGLSSNDYTDEDKDKLDSITNDITDLKDNKLDTSGGTIAVGDLKSNIPNGKIFHITQSSSNPVSGLYLDGNEQMEISGISENGNAILDTKYGYSNELIDYIGEEYPLNSNIAASNLINGVGFYRGFDSDRNFRCYASKQGSTKDLYLGLPTRPWTHIYAENIHSKTIDDLQSYIGYTDSDIYGVECDFENNIFTRLAGAVGKTAGADFDSISAFGGRRRCNLSDNGEVLAYYGEDGYVEGGTTGQVMVEQPKFYYKIVPLKLEKGVEGYILRKARYYVSDLPKAGFKLHPTFIKDNIEMDKAYFSAFESCIFDFSASEYLLNDEQIADFDADKLSSIANAKPASGSTQNLTRANARKLAHNRGNGWDQAIIQTISATQLLFLIEYGTFNSQTAIGIGVTNKADGTGNEAEKTGATSSLGSTSGSVVNANGYNIVSYRGEENFWGNIWAWVDGMNEENPATFASGDVGTLYVADHAFVDDSKASPYKNTGIHPDQGIGYISAFGYSEEYDWLFIPAEHTGNSSLPVGDRFWNNNPGWRVTILGGLWNDGASAGAFYWHLYNASSIRARNVGARLIYRPTPAQEVSE